MTASTRVWRATLGLALFLLLAFVLVAPPERCPSASAPELRRSAGAAVDWFVRNQEADGAWLYLYDADEESAAAEYNEVRHAGVTMGLYQATDAGLPAALRSADRGTDWALNRLLRREGWAALEGEGRVTTGATALLVAGLDIRREATGDARHDALLRRLGRFLIAQTERSGAVLAEYDGARGRPVPREYSKYYTGEAYWALARLHRTFPGEGWGQVADRIGTYLATTRDDAEDHWPPIPDHWAAYGLTEAVGFPERAGSPLSEQELDYARSQAGLFGAQARWLSQRHGPWGELVRPGSEARGGWYGVVDEALAGWWRVARAEPRLADLRAPIAERAACVAGLATEIQSDGADAAETARPDRVEGAWFVDGETRMDDQQHALAGLLRTIALVEAASGSSSDSDAPSGWLWALALLLALNPARAASGVPRHARSPLTLATGGAIGGLAVVAAALAGGPLLEALEVSEPSFRTAAGLVAFLAGAADLLRRPPAPEPALEGRRAALVPIAVPLVARPALLVMALAAGADSGVLPAAAAMVAGVSLLIAIAVAWQPGGPSGRALRWVGRVSGAALAACAVVLLIDGLLAV